jgi:hypothetical protein
MIISGSRSSRGNGEGLPHGFACLFHEVQKRGLSFLGALDDLFGGNSLAEELEGPVA